MSGFHDFVSRIGHDKDNKDDTTTTTTHQLQHINIALSMDSSLHTIWTAAESSPFQPAVAKDHQFKLGFGLLLLGISLSGIFALSMLFLSSSLVVQMHGRTDMYVVEPRVSDQIEPSPANVPLLGLPASLAFA